MRGGGPIYLLLTIALKEVWTMRQVDGFLNSLNSPACSLQLDQVLEHPLRIGAWNTQKFGKAKMKKEHVPDIIVKVMLRYDVIVLLDVTDAKEVAVNDLLEQLNEMAFYAESDYDPNDALREPAYDTYALSLSPRIGRSRYKEQYALYYRRRRLDINSTFLYPDPSDVFQAEPFVTVIDTTTAEVAQFAVVPIHTSPSSAVEEIDALVDVYNYIVENFDIKDVLLIGDFNAGCTYVTTDDWVNIRLHNNSQFEWLISDHLDTTTKGTDCPYDRIVVAGSALKDAIYDSSAQPFYFDVELNIDDEKLVEAVSDHYPVEVLIQGQVTSSLETRAKTEIGVIVELDAISWAVDELRKTCLEVVQLKNRTTNHFQRETFEEESENGEKEEECNSYEDCALRKSKNNNLDISNDKQLDKHFRDEVLISSEKQLNKSPPEDLRCGKNPTVVSSSPTVLVLEFSSEDEKSVMKLLKKLAAYHPCVFTPNDISVLQYKLSHGVLVDASVYGAEPPSEGIRTRVLCVVDSCTVIVTKRTSIV